MRSPIDKEVDRSDKGEKGKQGAHLGQTPRSDTMTSKGRSIQKTCNNKGESVSV
jgi:hypothetical protein